MHLDPLLIWLLITCAHWAQVNILSFFLFFFYTFYRLIKCLWFSLLTLLKLIYITQNVSNLSCWGAFANLSKSRRFGSSWLFLGVFTLFSVNLRLLIFYHSYAWFKLILKVVTAMLGCYRIAKSGLIWTGFCANWLFVFR